MLVHAVRDVRPHGRAIGELVERNVVAKRTVVPTMDTFIVLPGEYGSGELESGHSFGESYATGETCCFK